jgi:hypothetical protein
MKAKRFSRRHYRVVGRVLLNNKPKYRLQNEELRLLWKGIVSNFVEEFEEDNEKFDAEKFWSMVMEGGD